MVASSKFNDEVELTRLQSTAKAGIQAVPISTQVVSKTVNHILSLFIEKSSLIHSINKSAIWNIYGTENEHGEDAGEILVGNNLYPGFVLQFNNMNSHAFIAGLLFQVGGNELFDFLERPDKFRLFVKYFNDMETVVCFDRLA